MQPPRRYRLAIDRHLPSQTASSFDRHPRGPRALNHCYSGAIKRGLPAVRNARPRRCSACEDSMPSGRRTVGVILPPLEQCTRSRMEHWDPRRVCWTGIRLVETSFDLRLFITHVVLAFQMTCFSRVPSRFSCPILLHQKGEQVLRPKMRNETEKPGLSVC